MVLPIYVSTTSQSVTIHDIHEVELPYPLNNYRLDLAFNRKRIKESQDISTLEDQGLISFIDVEEKYGEFRLAMLSDPGWQRIKSLAAPQSVAELMGAMSYMDRGVNPLKIIWNLYIIDSLSEQDKPTPGEISVWNGLVNYLKIDSNWIPDEEWQINFDPSTGYLYPIVT